MQLTTEEKERILKKIKGIINSSILTYNELTAHFIHDDYTELFRVAKLMESEMLHLQSTLQKEFDKIRDGKV